ncbi:hypothetical protein CANARDRAFT_5487 [[Candida] arabinofermentans NRRL YB-2248]|uniref:DUF2433 domain-containing protein n=1 Tax=[Candida] arabinofermentans NRRL YB-2248 TaxID=983967 RepID=A0A1E4T956_9ASCO|nr:hypothetical protein CANARDRAFT_5487 [[Candida] arabinofermentans NRRL YB-2248]
MSTTRVLEKDGIKILAVADIRGELSMFNELARRFNADIIVHTGNFGFLDEGSVGRIHESYLRHIVEFSPLLPEKLISQISELSKVTGDAVEHLSSEQENLKKLLKDQNISELSKFISGEYKLEIPVYTICGMCEDSLVINKFRYGTYKIANLNIIDDGNVFTVTTKTGHTVLLAGIGGSLSYHKLFHQGSLQDLKDIVDDQTNFDQLDNSDTLLPISGDPGNIWITLLQLGRLIYKLTEFTENNAELYNKAIKIFITHQSPAREPLLEHLSIFFRMDYTISNSLHFKYTSSYNQLSINPSFESFKLKFNESRSKMAVIWKSVQQRYEKLLYKLNDPMIITCTELALEVFDKIPISAKGIDDIPPLQLSQSLTSNNETLDSFGLQSRQREIITIIRQLNDLYYISFQNTWHFNLCDLSYGHLVLDLQDGKLHMECKSNGYDFNYRLVENESESPGESNGIVSSTKNIKTAKSKASNGNSMSKEHSPGSSTNVEDRSLETNNGGNTPGRKMSFNNVSATYNGTSNNGNGSSIRGRGRGRGGSRGGMRGRGGGHSSNRDQEKHFT